MANDRGLVGESLLGLPKKEVRPPNTAPWWRYVLVLFVVAIGAIYAAPNLYQPDPALQIRATATNQVVTQVQLDAAVASLEAQGIGYKSVELTTDGAMVRLINDADQLRGRPLVEGSLNASSDDRYVVALNRASTTPAWLEDMGGKPMSLGLDLSGGVHFLLQIDMEKFVGDRLKSTSETVQDILRKERIRTVRAPAVVNGQSVQVLFASEDLRDQAQTRIQEDITADFEFTTREVEGESALTMTLTNTAIRLWEDAAVQQNLQSLRNRVNELGVSEPQVQRLGRSRIVLDLPGIQDSARAKEIINKFANLEFRLVAPRTERASLTENWEYEGAPVTLLQRNIVTGDQVTNAVQNFDPETGQPQVSITLDNDGGVQMNNATRDNIGNQMAIIFKELKVRSRTVEENGQMVVKPYTTEEARLINVATIQAALGFQFRITGLELGEARDLALLLRAGALAAPMYIVEERTVGASLGEENITRGILALQIGFSLVLVFMMIYYRWFGFAANVALLVNAMLIVAVMSLLGATLTMPGIAGIVLTIGMAVDANVLIFSRIREELRDRPPQQAMQQGFDRALLTILDANITTFFVAIILFSVGSGPVKGFAITLAVGIVTSMFTAILGTRLMINLMFGGRKLEKLSI